MIRNPIFPGIPVYHSRITTKMEFKPEIWQHSEDFDFFEYKAGEKGCGGLNPRRFEGLKNIKYMV